MPFFLYAKKTKTLKKKILIDLKKKVFLLSWILVNLLILLIKSELIKTKRGKCNN